MGVNEKLTQIVNMELDVELWRKVKAQAALEGKSVKDWVRGVLAEKIGDTFESSKPPEVKE